MLTKQVGQFCLPIRTLASRIVRGDRPCRHWRKSGRALVRPWLHRHRQFVKGALPPRPSASPPGYFSQENACRAAKYFLGPNTPGEARAPSARRGQSPQFARHNAMHHDRLRQSDSATTPFTCPPPFRCQKFLQQEVRSDALESPGNGRRTPNAGEAMKSLSRRSRSSATTTTQEGLEQPKLRAVAATGAPRAAACRLSPVSRLPGRDNATPASLPASQSS